MNFLPSFSVWQFAAAGAVCAAGPLIIHLLNRRRYRTVRWAAMDFLREALQRNRRILHLRDMLLLLLRTTAVLFVGLALAQPFLSQTNEAFDGTQPLHAVLVFDNSLSMAYQPTTGGQQEITLLTLAKQKAREFVEQLPIDSRISVIPLCGSRSSYSPDAFGKEDALRAIDLVEIVDRAASVQQAVNEARKACDHGPRLAKRVVLLGDQQAANWRDIRDGAAFEGLESVQVVDVSAVGHENSWIADFRVQDGVADVDTPTTFIAEVRHEGSAARENVQVTLAIDGLEVASRTVTLEPGLGAREIAFEHVFSTYRPEPGRPIAVPAEVWLTPDKLPDDDRRSLVCQVVASLPVVFVDQYRDDEEDAVRRRLGETRHLRRLLAPVTSRADHPRQLVKIRHVRFDELDQAALEDARLVVVAGIADPVEKVALLRDYVVQGGPLVIAAGGRFDPSINSGFDPQRWQDAAWLDGNGILPASLASDPLGATPDEADSELKPFFLDFDSLGGHHYFQLAGVGESELRDLYAEPFFFKAVRMEVGAESLAALRTAEIERIERHWRQSATNHSDRESDAEDAANDGDTPSASNPASPRWLLWASDLADLNLESPPADPAARERRFQDAAEATMPRVLARFDDPRHTPFLVERRIGRGTVICASSGTLSDWNTLPQTNAMLIFDRIFRSLIQATLPPRNFPAGERITLPLPAAESDLVLMLYRPGNDQTGEPLDTGFIGQEQRGFAIPQAFTRGLYRVVAYSNADADIKSGDAAAREKLWEMPVSINGAAGESELAALDRADFDQRIATPRVRWVTVGESISLAGVQIRGQDSWWWLATAVIALLLLELFVLSSSSTSPRAQASAAA